MFINFRMIDKIKRKFFDVYYLKIMLIIKKNMLEYFCNRNQEGTINGRDNEKDRQQSA